MQRGEVDICIVGADRVTATGDVANKVGTYLKALAAQDNGAVLSWMPFRRSTGASTRGPRSDRAARAAEVLSMPGRLPDGTVVTVEVAASGSRRQPGLRHHAGASRHRTHHRARHRAGDARRLAALYPERATPTGPFSQPGPPARPDHMSR